MQVGFVEEKLRNHGSAELWLSKDHSVVSFKGWRKLLGGRMSFPVRFCLSSQHPKRTRPWFSDTHLYASVEVQMLRSVGGSTTFRASSAVLSVPVKHTAGEIHSRAAACKAGAGSVTLLSSTLRARSCLYQQVLIAISCWWNTFTKWDLIFWSFISSCLWQLVFIFYQLLLSPDEITVRFGSLSPLTPQILLSLVGMYILGQFRLCQCCHWEKHNFCFVSSQSIQDFPSFVNWKCLWK